MRKREVRIMNNNEIRVKVNGGYLVAGRNADPNNEGVYVVFETDNGDIKVFLPSVTLALNKRTAKSVAA